MYSWLVFTSKLNKKLQKTFIGRQVLRVNSGATALEYGTVSSGANAGEVIQVLGATDSTTRNTTSTSFVTASNTLSVTITPSSTSSRFFIISTLNRVGGGSSNGQFTIFRDATNIGGANGLGSPAVTDVGDFFSTITVLDSPNTASAITYQVYMRVASSGTNGLYTAGNAFSSITVFEIKG